MLCCTKCHLTAQIRLYNGAQFGHKFINKELHILCRTVASFASKNELAAACASIGIQTCALCIVQFVVEGRNLQEPCRIALKQSSA